MPSTSWPSLRYVKNVGDETQDALTKAIEAAALRANLDPATGEPMTLDTIIDRHARAFDEYERLAYALRVLGYKEAPRDHQVAMRLLGFEEPSQGKSPGSRTRLQEPRHYTQPLGDHPFVRRWHGASRRARRAREEASPDPDPDPDSQALVAQGQGASRLTRWWCRRDPVLRVAVTTVITYACLTALVALTATL